MHGAFRTCLAGVCAFAAFGQNVSSVIPTLYGPKGLILPTNDVAHVAHFNSQFQSNFTPLNSAIGSQLTLLPIASPASGFVYSRDESTGLTVRSTQSLGPIMSERAETIGRHKLFVAFTNQTFRFDKIDGIRLGQLHSVFEHDQTGNARDLDVITTWNDVNLSLSQNTAFVTFGLNDRMDISVALPMVTSNLSVVSDAQIKRIATADRPLTHTFNPTADVPQSQFRKNAGARGIGDITLRVKNNVYRSSKLSMALGLDTRLPAGDELNFLGSGAAGVRPFVAASMGGRISPHVNIGYQWNGSSVLAGNVMSGAKASLPDALSYAFGADVGVTRTFTFAADFFGQRLMKADSVQSSAFRATNGALYPTTNVTRRDLNVNSIAVGFKLNLLGNLLATSNLLVRVNDAGLHDAVVPLFGLSYTF